MKPKYHEDARNLARLLTECADDIAARGFIQSRFSTASFTLENNGSRY